MQLPFDQRQKFHKHFPVLSNLIGGYLNQDYDIFADSLDGVVDYYLKDGTTISNNALRLEIADFLEKHGAKLDATFASIYGFDFDPSLWDFTAEEFLKWLDKKVAASGDAKRNAAL